MKQWLILFNKEWKESIRNFKWIWIPIVFILLGVTQPILSYYLPDLLEQFGGMPEGAVINLPLPSGPQVLSETLGQFSQIGFLVLVLAFMGAIAGERNSGTHLMILVKPVSHISYITSKWVHMSLLAVVSFILGYSFAIYYTFLLIETIPASHIIKGGAVYVLWLVFVMTLVISFSTIIKSTAAVAFLTLGVTIALSLLSSLLPDLMRWSPGMLSRHSQGFLTSGAGGQDFWLSLAITVILIFAMLSAAIYIFRQKEFAVDSN